MQDRLDGPLIALRQIFLARSCMGQSGQLRKGLQAFATKSYQQLSSARSKQCGSVPLPMEQGQRQNSGQVRIQRHEILHYILLSAGLEKGMCIVHCQWHHGESLNACGQLGIRLLAGPHSITLTVGKLVAFSSKRRLGSAVSSSNDPPFSWNCVNNPATTMPSTRKI